MNEARGVASVIPLIEGPSRIWMHAPGNPVSFWLGPFYDFTMALVSEGSSYLHTRSSSSCSRNIYKLAAAYVENTPYGAKPGRFEKAKCATIYVCNQVTLSSIFKVTVKFRY